MGGLGNSGSSAGAPSTPSNRSKRDKGRKAGSFHAHIPATKSAAQFPGFVRRVQLSCYLPPAQTGWTRMDLLREGAWMGAEPIVTHLWAARYVFRNNRRPFLRRIILTYVFPFVTVVGGSLWLVYKRKKGFCNHKAAWLYFSTYLK